MKDLSKYIEKALGIFSVGEDICTPLIQRKMQLSYNNAKAVFVELEKQGRIQRGEKRTGVSKLIGAYEKEIAEKLLHLIKESSIEYHYEKPNKCGDVAIFLEPSHLKEFTKILGYNFFDDGNLDCTMSQDGSIRVEMLDICDYFGIKLISIFYYQDSL